MKPKTYWAGYVKGELLKSNLLLLYRKRKEAAMHYEDVRKVRIVEVK